MQFPDARWNFQSFSYYFEIRRKITDLPGDKSSLVAQQKQKKKGRKANDLGETWKGIKNIHRSPLVIDG